MNEKWLSKKLRSNFRYIRLRSFEACGLQDVPDLMGTFKGFTFWIELKCVASVNAKINFRKGQPAWIEDYQKDGGLVLLFVLDKARSDLYLIVPTDIRGVVAQGKLQKVYHAHSGSIFRLGNIDVWDHIERSALIQLGRFLGKTGFPVP